MTTVYKLTDAKMQTHGGFQWTLGETAKTDGRGDLCGSGWLHYYSDPLLAVFLNPVHANYGSDMRLFRATAGPVQKHDRGLKSGTTELTLVEELRVPRVTPAQCAKFARLCSDWAASAATGPRLAHDAIGAQLAAMARKAAE